LAGAVFCYWVVFPFTLEFTVWLAVYLKVRPSYTPEHYMDLLVTFMLIFGLTFELPLVAAALARLRLLRPTWLLKPWRYIIVGCFVLGAALSPGTDPISMLILSGALLFLYVLSIILAVLAYPKEPPG
jgi:sec-independent protein translocase protein TatC